MYFLARPGSDPDFVESLKFLKGKYAKDCLKKIRKQGGTIVCINTASLGPKPSETIHYTAVRANAVHWFHIRTDDVGLESCQVGPRYNEGKDMMVAAIANDMILLVRPSPP
jgi:hypothetical protein